MSLRGHRVRAGAIKTRIKRESNAVSSRSLLTISWRLMLGRSSIDVHNNNSNNFGRRASGTATAFRCYYTSGCGVGVALPCPPKREGPQNGLGDDANATARLPTFFTFMSCVAHALANVTAKTTVRWTVLRQAPTYTAQLEMRFAAQVLRLSCLRGAIFQTE